METNQNKIKPFKSAAEQTESWMLLFDMLLAAHERREAEKTAELPDFNAVMHNLLERGNASFQDGIDLPLNALILKFGLSPFEAFCVMLAFAAETDRKYESVFALFNNIPEIKKPTLGLLAELFLLITGESITAVNSEAHFTAYSENAVMRFLFESFADKPELSRLSAPLSLNKTALYYLNQSNLPPDDLNPYCKIYPYEIFDGENEPLICHKSETEKLIAVIKNQYEEQELTCLLNIHGQAGVGKRFILRRACVDLKRDIIFADYSYLIQNPFNQIRKHADLLIAYCILHDSLLCLENFNVSRENQAVTHELLKELSKYLNLIALISKERLVTLPPDNCVYHGVEVKTASFEEQRALWGYFVKHGEYNLSKETNIETIISSYDLPAGHIRDVLKLSEIESVAADTKSISHRHIINAIREKNRAEISAYAELMRTDFTWEDLILSEESEKVLKKVCARVLYKRVVNDKWGMGRKLPYGRGLSVVLYGPPGTGKTMAAQVIANEIGRDIYRVELSRMISKYVGETEKNLGEVFDAAQNVNAVLFFDEADALFSKRTEVKEAKDKFANTETSYLLQKMEAYNGITVLATNYAVNFDTAFKRRINYFVNIEMPDENQRLKIWQSLINEKLPLDEKVNLNSLAKKFELSGSEIKSALIEAAYTAAAENSRITQELLLNAVSDEYKKSGRILFEQDKI